MSPDTQRNTRSLWWSFVVTPLSIGILGGYGLWRAPYASELELIGFSLFILLMMLFPRLRSGLLRRRALVNVWMHRSHPLRQWLQGGAFYLSFQLLFMVPMSIILLVELRHLSRELWIGLIFLGGICGGVRILIYTQIHRILRYQAASVIAREWTVYVFLAGAAALMLINALYAERPYFDQTSLAEALLITSDKLPQQRDGFLSTLIFLSAFKENIFTWSVIHLPDLLKGAPALIVWLCEHLLYLIYAFYQLVISFTLSQYVAGSFDMVDQAFYRFLRGSKSKEE